MADAATWTKRVRAWRASGKTADAFCVGRDFAPATLKWWSWRLKNKPARKVGPKRSKSRAIPMARVVRSSAATVTLVSSAIAIELRRSRVVVPAGADRTTLEAVLELLVDRDDG